MRSLREAALLVPGLLMVGALLLLPLGWLLGLSLATTTARRRCRTIAASSTIHATPRASSLTFQIAGTVTVLAVLLGYPLCYWMLAPAASRGSAWR